MLKVENSVLSVTPENDPAYGIGKRLSIEYSYGNEPRRKIERWEGTTFVFACRSVVRRTVEYRSI